METLVKILLATYSAVLPVMVGYVIKMQRQQKRERDANARGTMLLLRVQLIEYHDKYMTAGAIPSYAYQNYCEMFEAYRDLGGNGMIKKMRREIDELHLGRRKRNYGAESV